MSINGEMAMIDLYTILINDVGLIQDYNTRYRRIVPTISTILHELTIYCITQIKDSSHVK
jgi:hypothetical protein